MPYRVDWIGIPNIVQYILNNAGPHDAGNWAITNDAENKIRNIITAEQASFIFDENDSRIQNRKLREVISPYLIGGNTSQKEDFAKWVVTRWGGIYGSDATQKEIEGWAITFNNYEWNVIKHFIAAKGINRVASWSKVLAFARPDYYAIFDSRIALALNILLIKNTSLHRFMMPPSQIKIRNNVISHIKNSTRIIFMQRNGRPQRNRYLGYANYLDLLRAMVHFNHADDILQAEMILFANAPTLIDQYINDNKIR